MQTEILLLPIVKILLIAVFFLALLIEIKTAGTGIGALLGIIAAGALFSAEYMAGSFSFFEIIIFLAGVVFITIELILPGVGLFAVIGVMAVFYSFIMTLGGNILAFYALLISLVLAIAAFSLIVKRLPSSRLWNNIVLKDAETGKKGFLSGCDYSSLLGQKGIVVSKLRPAGTIEIGEEKFDVISKWEFIDVGDNVEVVEIIGNKIIVNKIK